MITKFLRPRKAKIYIAIFGGTFLTTEICGMSARFCMMTDALNFPYLKSMSITHSQLLRDPPIVHGSHVYMTPARKFTRSHIGQNFSCTIFGTKKHDTIFIFAVAIW